MTKMLSNGSNAPGNGTAAARWQRRLALQTSIPGCALVLLAPPAHADMDRAAWAYADRYAPAVCSTLDSRPITPAGLAGLTMGIVHDGLSPFQAGEVIGYSVATLCPWHISMVFRNMPEAEYLMNVWA